jgi:AraC-like DNA-binding protein
MREKLVLDDGFDGKVWPYEFRGLTRRPHRHEELEINLVIRGRARYLMRDRRHDLSSGTLIWLFPDQEHLLIDESDDFAMWIVVWRQKLVRRACTTEKYKILRQRDPDGNFCKTLPTELASQLGRLHADVEKVSSDADLVNAGLAYLLTSAWAAHETAPDRPARTLHPSVEEAVRLLRNEREPMTLTELAERSGLSASRLSRVFKRETGVSLVHFRQRMQLERFQQLRESQPNHTLLATALDAGFGSYAQFHRVYKQTYGKGPGRE